MHPLYVSGPVHTFVRILKCPSVTCFAITRSEDHIGKQVKRRKHEHHWSVLKHRYGSTVPSLVPSWKRWGIVNYDLLVHVWHELLDILVPKMYRNHPIVFAYVYSNYYAATQCLPLTTLNVLLCHHDTPVHGGSSPHSLGQQRTSSIPSRFLDATL